MQQSNSPGCLLEHSTRTCSAGCAQHWGDSPCKYRGYSQKLISFHIFVTADFDWPSKKGSFSETVLFTFKKCYDTFSQGPEGLKSYKFGTAKKGTDSQVSEEERDLNTHPRGPAQSSRFYRRHPWTINQQLFLAW